MTAAPWTAVAAAATVGGHLDNGTGCPSGVTAYLWTLAEFVGHKFAAALDILAPGMPAAAHVILGELVLAEPAQHATLWATERLEVSGYRIQRDIGTVAVSPATTAAT